jgi:histidinol dehydrogenase
LEIVQGFTSAKARLSRRVVANFGEISPGIKNRLKEVFGRAISPEKAVDRILNDVRKKGDKAVIDYTFRIDGFKLESLEISPKQISRACDKLDKELVEALNLAAARIREFHREQKEYLFKGVDGRDWAQLVRPLERVGLYAPGGTASYPSTVLMTAIPAKVAGVKEIILVTPPRHNGNIPPAVLAAAGIAGVDRVFSLGGAQAVAALAYGTESIPAVDKICGPGNIFVALAKKKVSGTVAIDGFMGPSEVLIIADEESNPCYCAADLIAQAEHDTLSQAILVTTSAGLAVEIEQQVHDQLIDLPRGKIVREALENRGVIAIVKNIPEAIELANLYAPEHLELLMENAASYVDRITNAGCIFVGEYSPVPVGDYIAGPNHSLPTGGTARFSSPLNVADFVKFIDVVKVDSAGLKELGKTAATLARAEGLEAHARAIDVRFSPDKPRDKMYLIPK